DERPGRTPVFIDRDGRHCAVGHLVRASAGAEAALAIDDRHHLDLVADMDPALLAPWASDHGFTLRELAMIQPTYRVTPLETTQRRLELQLVGNDRLSDCGELLEPDTAALPIEVELYAVEWLESRLKLQHLELGSLAPSALRTCVRNKLEEAAPEVVGKSQGYEGVSGRVSFV